MKIALSPRIGSQRNLTGQIFGYLTVIATSDRRSGDSVMWQCECNCNHLFCPKVIYVNSSSLVHGRCISCKKHRGKRSVAVTQYYSMTRFGALKRNYVFELSLLEFYNLIKLSCYYCGSNKDIKHIYDGNKYKLAKTNTSKLFCLLRANGIDRLDNTLGYTVKNCVPCCGECNEAKMNRTVQAYLDHCRKVVLHNSI